MKLILALEVKGITYQFVQEKSVDLQTHSDLANKTEHDPIAPETTAYENGSSIFQQELISWPGVDNKTSPFLNIPIKDIKKEGR